MHSGRIAVESRVGSGSTFTVTLLADPRTPAEKAAASPKASTATPRRPRRGRAKTAAASPLGTEADEAAAERKPKEAGAHSNGPAADSNGPAAGSNGPAAGSNGRTGKPADTATPGS
jgi:hypothetical protein